jgi:hypothetical protein
MTVNAAEFMERDASDPRATAILVQARVLMAMVETYLEGMNGTT